jgi:ankyrin repeat protein
LVKDLGADVSQGVVEGFTPLIAASQNGKLANVMCLVKELGADVNEANSHGGTPLHVAVQFGHIDVMRCLVKELGANVNQGDNRGATPLILASHYKHTDMVKWLVKAGANPNTSMDHFGTAADISKRAGATTEQTAYLEAKMNCSSHGCSGAGIKKCTGCKQVRYCGEPCQLAHWKAHKADCKRWTSKRTSN